MNIAVLADIHGNYHALRLALDDMARCGVDGVIVLGDVIFPGEAPQECHDAVKKLNPLVWLRGNTDNWLNEISEKFVPGNDIERRVLADFNRVRPLISDEAAGFIAALPEKQTVEICGKKLLCVLGSDRRINEPVGVMTVKEELCALTERMGADILLCAHTHSPYIAAMDGKLIINAGSVGKPQDSPGPCYCLLRFGDVFEYGFRKLA
jgi:putative phosphoesterase